MTWVVEQTIINDVPTQGYWLSKEGGILNRLNLGNFYPTLKEAIAACDRLNAPPPKVEYKRVYPPE